VLMGLDCHLCSTWCTCDFGWYRFRDPKTGKCSLWIGGSANRNRDAFEQRFNHLVALLEEELKPISQTSPRRAGVATSLRELNRLIGGCNGTSKSRTAATGTGMTLIVLVGLAIAFLLFMAFLNVVKSGNLLNEENLLFAALIFYSGAGALYLGFGVTGTESYVKFASLATWLGLLANTAAIAHRWYESGHAPFSSVYEMLLSFVWTLAVLTLVAEKKYGVKVIGTVTMPVAIVGVVLMQLLRTEVHPLVPALQSTWLHVHVTLAMLAYAACALSFALAMMFLIQDNTKTETFLAVTSASTLAIYASIVLTRFRESGAG
jgi:ABC-type transport system involved in cytochrome c biogenesis permease subunit